MRGDAESHFATYREQSGVSRTRSSSSRTSIPGSRSHRAIRFLSVSSLRPGFAGVLSECAIIRAAFQRYRFAGTRLRVGRDLKAWRQTGFGGGTRSSVVEQEGNQARRAGWNGLQAWDYLEWVGLLPKNVT